MENRKNAQTGTTIRSAVINQAISYIFEHMDEDITVEDVAHHCAYSKYHLTRMFKEDTGEALYHFIKRVRLERSAWRLKVEKEKSITEIGEEYGYSSSNFATAFKKHLDLSPAAFRKSSEQIVEESSFSHGITLDQLDEAEKLITIENLQGFMVVYERKRGNYHNLSDEWGEFIDKYEYLATKDTLYIDCTIDDPSSIDEDNCMYELCQTISPTHPVLKEHTDILTHHFEGGKYAIYHFKGFPQFLFMVYQEIFCRWLSRTGNQMDERPVLDIYRDAHEALRKYAHAFYQYAMDNPGIFEAMLWYNKYKSEELIKATEKVYTFFFAQTDKLHIDREVANHLLRTYRAFLEGFLLLVIHDSFGNPISIEESFALSLDVLISGMKQYET